MLSTLNMLSTPNRGYTAPLPPCRYNRVVVWDPLEMVGFCVFGCGLVACVLYFLLSLFDFLLRVFGDMLWITLWPGVLCWDGFCYLLDSSCGGL